MTKSLLTIAIFLFSALAMRAETADSITLDQVVVTGTRTPKSLKDAPIQTRVITLDDIRKTDATDIEDLLRQELPGVEFSYAMNQMKHMNFSGFGGQNVLFLVDGERLAGETMDDVDFTRLNMANVERIEIIKGAASALYGSNANGGVINIITKAPEDSFRARLHGRYGQHNEWRYGANVEWGSRLIQNVLSFQGTHLDSYNLSNGSEAQSANIVSEVLGEKTYNVNDKITWRPLQNLSVTGQLGYYFKEGENKNDGMVPWHFRDLRAGLKSRWAMTDRDDIEVAYNYDQYDKARHYRLTDKCYREYSNVQNSLRILYNHTFSGNNILTLGVDHMNDYLRNTNLKSNGETTGSDSYRQSICDFFAQYDWTASERLEVIGAIRYDHFSDGGMNRVTPKVNLRYKPARNCVVRAGYGTGFRTPALKEKYYSFNMSGIWDVVGGDKAGHELKPELSHNFTLSTEYTRGGYNVMLSGYYNHIRNRITTSAPRTRAEFYAANPGAPEGIVSSNLWIAYINVNTYNTFGFDITAQARWHNGWSARLSYAYVNEPDVKDADGYIINNQYTKARPHSVNARIEWEHKFASWYRLNVMLSGRFLSGVDNIEYKDYVTRDAATNELLRISVHHSAYTLWKLSAMNHFKDRYHLTLTLENLFNYKPSYYYFNTPTTTGTNLSVGLSVDI